MTSRARVAALVVMVGLFGASPAFAYVPGDLDTSFSGDGKTTTNVGGEEALTDLVILPSGRILSVGWTGVGNSWVVLTRHRPNGALDRRFSDDGIVLTPFGRAFATAGALTVQSDGKILVAGQRNRAFLLLRYGPGGRLDRTFSGDGIVTTEVTGSLDTGQAIALQSNGKILVGGTAGGAGGRFALVRYFRNGRIDRGFSGDGKVLTDFGPGEDTVVAIAVQPDGKIIAGARGNSPFGYFALARYTRAGALDPSFSGDGKTTTDFRTSPDMLGWGNRLALQPDGKIVVVGLAGIDAGFVLARFGTDGELDATFDGDGRVETDFGSESEAAQDVVIQADGKIVVGGYFGSNFALARYTEAGSPDLSFSNDGRLVTSVAVGFDMIAALALQADGRIVAGGPAGEFTRLALARFLAE